jgi:hypothetical protein
MTARKASTEVATTEAPQVPALAPTPALNLDASDIALSRIYTGQFMSQAVQARRVNLGDIYAATSADDPDPEVLWAYHEGNLEPGEGVLAHVIGLRKGKSVQDGSGGLALFDFTDPEAPEDAHVTYNYTLACPELDTDVPYRLTLAKTGTKTAQRINTAILRAAHLGPSYALAFRLTTRVTKNAKGTFAIMQATQVEADPGALLVAEKLFVAIGAQAPVERAVTEADPEI